MAKLADIWIFRLVHVENLPTLLRRGGLHAPIHVPNDGLAYRSIHDVDVQSARHQRFIPCGPKGTITAYVPFYFGRHSPMLFRLHTGRVAGYDQGQRPVLHLVSSVEDGRRSPSGASGTIDRGVRPMIRLTRGNLLTADAEALVNTVNTVGVMGKGIALQFKQAFPGNYDAYRRACKQGDVRPGRMLVFETGRDRNPRYIVNFPTKRHWRNKSRPEDIRAGLEALVDEIRARRIRSVAIPPLGCGNGGLDWALVRPMIEEAMERIPDVEALVYEPAGAPDPWSMPIGTKRPRMTRARALLVKLFEQYSVLGYSRSLLEAQKLAYFLQEAGEALRLRYQRGHYGPYAPNLNKVLERLEGHFTRGYGDSQRPDAQIDLLPGAVEEADLFLAGEDEARARLARLAALLEGFETPYGMELLASVHWVAHHENEPAREPESAVAAIREWTRRKAELFQPYHVQVAWERLTSEGWI